jgi:hypothetical protein
MNPKFYNKDGSLTRYSLACGYIEKRGTDEAYVTLEQISSNGALVVRLGGRWLREWVYTGPSLMSARYWFRKVDLAERARIARENHGGLKN